MAALEWRKLELDKHASVYSRLGLNEGNYSALQVIYSNHLNSRWWDPIEAIRRLYAPDRKTQILNELGLNFARGGAIAIEAFLRSGMEIGTIDLTHKEFVKTEVPFLLKHSDLGNLIIDIREKAQEGHRRHPELAGLTRTLERVVGGVGPSAHMARSANFGLGITALMLDGAYTQAAANYLHPVTEVKPGAPKELIPWKACEWGPEWVSWMIANPAQENT